ncbi:MAG: methyltransferase [Myxococcales bacterium]|nr:methyltransferase [Myxococcales bacterium]
MSRTAPASDLHDRFAALTEVLRAHRGVWHPRPFEGPPMDWEARHPDVAAYIDGLPLEVFDAFDASWVGPDAPATLRVWAEAAAAHADLPRLSAEHPTPLPIAAQRGLPGRKVSQIEHFLSAVEAAGLGPAAAGAGQPAAATDQPAAATGQPAAATGQPAAATGQPAAATGQSAAATGAGPGHGARHGPSAAGPGASVTGVMPLAAGPAARGTVVDWCAGKGHLGRALCARHGARLLAVEWDAALCDDGRLRCAREGVEAEFACLDARGPDAAERLGPGQTAIALHACGDLHSALLRAAAARGVEAIALAPCCYNKAGAERGHALSAAGAAANLGLIPADLDLVHREQVVARGRDRRRAWQSMAWRLGFDLLQRDVRAVDRYRPMRAFPNAWLTLPFADFCRRFAAVDGLALPADLDPTPYEARGWERLAQVRPRDAVRGLFRPTLEAWLVLDRALFLAERGFAVQVGRFCPRALTPRNAVVIARRLG